MTYNNNCRIIKVNKLIVYFTLQMNNNYANEIDNLNTFIKTITHDL